MNRQVASDIPPLAAIPGSERIDAIDILRGVALFGVMAVNLLTEFRISIFEQFLPQAAAGNRLDQWAATLASLVLEQKAFSIFALLFGIGLAVQFERLSVRPRPWYWLSRRLLALLLFGLVHLLLIWNGDILTEYAIAGLLILPLLYAPLPLVACAALLLLALYCAQPVLPPSMPWPGDAAFAEAVTQARQIYPHGSIGEIWRLNFAQIALLLPLHALVLPRTLGLMLCGIGLWRSGIVRNPARHRNLFALVALLGIASGCGLSAANAAGKLGNLNDGVIDSLTPILMAFGYAGGILGLSQLASLQRALRGFAALGRMAFSNYIAQSLIFDAIFYGPGLGQFGQTGAAITLLIGIAVYALEMVWSIWWLARFRFGPLEWLWRGMMYGKRPPMRVAR